MEPKSAPPLRDEPAEKILSERPAHTEPDIESTTESPAVEPMAGDLVMEDEVTTEAEDVSTEQPAEEADAQPDTEDKPEPHPDSAPPKAKRSLKKPVLITILILLNVGFGGANAYLHMRPATTHADKLPAKTTTVASAEAAPKTTATTATPAVSENKTLHYVSKPLNLEFDYPVSWRISSNSDNTSMSLTSAPFTLTDTKGRAALSNISMSISTGNTTNDAFSYLNDTDVMYADSEALVYAHPTTVQRKQTNLSFSGYPDNTNDGINRIFVSGTNVYKKGDTVGSKDYKKVDPHISLYVDGCVSEKCQALIESPFSINDWHTNPEMLKAKAIIESLQLN